MVKKSKVDEKIAKNNSKFILIGCLFLGIALGLIFDKVVAGTLMGLGIGFIAKYLASK